MMDLYVWFFTELQWHYQSFRVRGEQCFPFCTGTRLAKVADSQKADIQCVTWHFVCFDWLVVCNRNSMFDSNNFSDWLLCNDSASQSFKEYIYSIYTTRWGRWKTWLTSAPSASAHSTCRALPVLVEMWGMCLWGALCRKGPSGDCSALDIKQL